MLCSCGDVNCYLTIPLCMQLVRVLSCPHTSSSVYIATLGLVFVIKTICSLELNIFSLTTIPFIVVYHSITYSTVYHPL